ncbi:hypothetical protein FDP41_005642 [Naegleria fowleri]|uniref:ADF-H domain-containing protein n=1 Tax=Naegleria fowleri TaxID=5763 RepID=A0A6A5BNC5_NAEFO|nr:uncharacterized protein FDP41_005642 [Naegleria fowleri]KAF0975648.1 hypothetical protein FDP41_005642 [Naegleria fowleri]CAG4710968.1 unnamed protein product [Naegleria fowleri]
MSFNATNITINGYTLTESNYNRLLSGIVISSVFASCYLLLVCSSLIFIIVKKFQNKSSNNNEKSNQSSNIIITNHHNTNSTSQSEDDKKLFRGVTTLQSRISSLFASREWNAEKTVFTAFMVLFQLYAISLFWIFFEFPISGNSYFNIQGDYKTMIDVSLMVLCGLGFLTTCFRSNSYQGIGMGFLLTTFSFQFSILSQAFWFKIYEYSQLVSNDNTRVFNTVIYLDMRWMVHGFYGAFSVLTACGVIIGKATPLQLVTMSFSHIFIYSLNYFVCILILGALDYGGSMFIHLFGAYFGLSASWGLYKTVPFAPSDFYEMTSKENDLFAIIGTVLMWVLWPSFNSALVPTNHLQQFRAQMATIIAMTGSCCAHFALSRAIRGKFAMRDVQRASLAGGIAMASCHSILVSPGGALTIGVVAGCLSGFSAIFIAPLLKWIKLHDSCDIHSTHGIVGIYGGIVSIIAVGNQNANPSNLIYGQTVSDLFAIKNLTQWGYQACCLIISLALSISGGAFYGFIYNTWFFTLQKNQLFEDAIFWNVPIVKSEGLNTALLNQDEKKNNNHLVEMTTTVSTSSMVDLSVDKKLKEHCDKSKSEMEKYLAQQIQEMEKKYQSEIQKLEENHHSSLQKINKLEQELSILVKTIQVDREMLKQKEEEERQRREEKQRARREEQQRQETQRKQQEKELKRLKEEQERKMREQEAERKRKEEEEQRKAKEQQQSTQQPEEKPKMSRIMEDLLSKSTTTEDKEGVKYQKFEGVNVDYNFLNAYDMFRCDDAFIEDDDDNLDSSSTACATPQSIPMTEARDDDENAISEYDRLKNARQRASNYIILHQDQEDNSKYRFLTRCRSFDEVLPLLTADTMYHIVMRVLSKESKGISLYKFLVASFAGENIRAMQRGIFAGHSNTLGKFLGIIAFQVKEKDSIKEEILEKVKSAATGNVQNCTFTVL